MLVVSHRHGPLIFVNFRGTKRSHLSGSGQVRPSMISTTQKTFPLSININIQIYDIDAFFFLVHDMWCFQIRFGLNGKKKWTRKLSHNTLACAYKLIYIGWIFIRVYLKIIRGSIFLSMWKHYMDSTFRWKFSPFYPFLPPFFLDVPIIEFLINIFLPFQKKM